MIGRDHEKDLLAFITVIALMFAAPLAATAATNTSNAEGYSTPCSTLAANWWTWMLTQPAPTNPILDTTGTECANQQSGSTWFLGGLFGVGGTLTRACTIPAHTAGFFPLANAFDCEQSGTPTDTVAYVRAQTAFVQNGASKLSVTLDGKVLPSSLIQFENSVSSA